MRYEDEQRKKDPMKYTKKIPEPIVILAAGVVGILPHRTFG
jgi:hypothetical protein